MALSIQQETTYLGKERWQWSVWVDGAAEELDDIDHVMYVLDRTFHDPVREVSDRSTNFRLEAKTWGEFKLYANAIHRDGHETHLQHDLILVYPDGAPTAA